MKGADPQLRALAVASPLGRAAEHSNTVERTSAVNFPLRPIRIVARDRRKAAMRVAGPVVVAKSLGVDALYSYIEPSQGSYLDGGTVIEERTWQGCSGFQQIQSLVQRRMISVAGAVAECCWHGSDVEAVSFSLEYEPEFMSSSDWAIAGCASGEPTPELVEAAKQVFSLLTRFGGVLWPALLTEARQLIITSRQHLETQVELRC